MGFRNAVMRYGMRHEIADLEKQDMRYDST